MLQGQCGAPRGRSGGSSYIGSTYYHLLGMPYSDNVPDDILEISNIKTYHLGCRMKQIQEGGASQSLKLHANFSAKIHLGVLINILNFKLLFIH